MQSPPLITMELLHNLVPMCPVPVGGLASVMRVPGGWVMALGSGCCFVPYNGEFDPFYTNKT